MRVKKLGDLVSITGGGTPDRSNESFWGCDIPWVTVKDFKSLEISGAKEHITAAGLASSASNLIPAGSIIVPTRMALGKAAINTTPIAINQDLKALRIKDPSIIDRDFLFRFLLSKSAYLESQGKGATVKGITLDVLREIDVPLPPKTEQQRIAAILDKADSLHSKRQQALRLTDRFLRSTFIDMFGDPIANEKCLPVRLLGDVCRFYAGNSLPNGEPFDGQTGGFLHIKVGDMNLPGNEVEIHIAREWSSRGFGAIIAPAGSILIPKRGGAIATNKKRVLSRPCALDPNLMAIEPGEKLRQEVLVEWFKLFDLSSISSGSAVPQLNKGDLAPLKITVPPLEMQDKFVKIAKKVKSMLARQGDQLALIQSVSAALSFTLLDHGPKND